MRGGRERRCLPADWVWQYGADITSVHQYTVLLPFPIPGWGGGAVPTPWTWEWMRDCLAMGRVMCVISWKKHLIANPQPLSLSLSLHYDGKWRRTCWSWNEVLNHHTEDSLPEGLSDMQRPGFKSLRLQGLVCLGSKTKSVLTYAHSFLAFSPSSSGWSSRELVLHVSPALTEIQRRRPCAFSCTGNIHLRSVMDCFLPFKQKQPLVNSVVE